MIEVDNEVEGWRHAGEFGTGGRQMYFSGHMWVGGFSLHTPAPLARLSKPISCCPAH